MSRVSSLPFIYYRRAGSSGKDIHLSVHPINLSPAREHSTPILCKKAGLYPLLNVPLTSRLGKAPIAPELREPEFTQTRTHICIQTKRFTLLSSINQKS